MRRGGLRDAGRQVARSGINDGDAGGRQPRREPAIEQRAAEIAAADKPEGAAKQNGPAYASPAVSVSAMRSASAASLP